MSRLPIRDSSILSLLIGSSDKVSGGWRKGRKHKSTVYKIKSLSTNYGSPSQQLLTTKSILKDPSDQVDVINTKENSPTIVDILIK